MMNRSSASKCNGSKIVDEAAKAAAVPFLNEARAVLLHKVTKVTVLASRVITAAIQRKPATRFRQE